MSNVRTIRAFLASPRDLEVERRAFQDVMEEFNVSIGARVKLESLGWIATHVGRIEQADRWEHTLHFADATTYLRELHREFRYLQDFGILHREYI